MAADISNRPEFADEPHRYLFEKNGLRPSIETSLHADVLCIIDCRIGCTVQEYIWRAESDALHHRLERCDVTLISINRDNVESVTLSSDEVVCEHSLSSCDKDFLFLHILKYWIIEIVLECWILSILRTHLHCREVILIEIL